MKKFRYRYLAALILLAVGSAVVSCSLPEADQGTVDQPQQQGDGQTDPDPGIPAPVPSVESGTYETDVLVEITPGVPEGTVHYTIDEGNPTAESEVYTGPIEVPGDGDEHTIRAVTIDRSGRISQVVEKKYAIRYKDKVATPKLSPRKGTYDHPISVSITTATPGAVIRYTTDGSKPGPNSAVYSGPIPVPEGADILVKAVAYKSGLKGSSHAIGRYIVKGMVPVQDRDILFRSDRITAIQPDSEESGEIVSVPLHELYRMTPTGADQTRLTYGFVLWEGPYPRPHEFWGQADWSPDGKKIVYSYIVFQYEDVDEELFVMNADGTDSRSIARVSEGLFNNPVWSPDGNKIAVAVLTVFGQDGLPQGIHTMNPDGSNKLRLRTGGGAPDFHADRSPSWTPDASHIVFESYEGGIWIMRADGTGAMRIPGQTTENTDPDKNPVRDLIAYTTEVNGQWDIYVMKTDGTGVMRLTDSPADERWPDWSIDGSELAFATDRDGNWEIYTMNADGTNETNVSNHPANETYPYW